MFLDLYKAIKIRQGKKAQCIFQNTIVRDNY